MPLSRCSSNLSVTTISAAVRCTVLLLMRIMTLLLSPRSQRGCNRDTAPAPWLMFRVTTNGTRLTKTFGPPPVHHGDGAASWLLIHLSESEVVAGSGWAG